MRQFFAESVRQPGESAERHAHSKVLPFHVRRADVVRLGIAERLNPKFLFGPIYS